jgi:hypothetical protein
MNLELIIFKFMQHKDQRCINKIQESLYFLQALCATSDECKFAYR